ncbi:MAG: aspartate--tRNA ligase [Planctomycetes bacterium]|nr:aspartate--tRNA ligase [Planctomycetota bacterium]
MSTPGEIDTTDWRRTHTCGELRTAHVGAQVRLNGWVDGRRDHGGVYFLDLRDRYGTTQVVIDEELTGEVKLGPEDVVGVWGEVVARGAENRNPALATGEIEVLAKRVEVLSKSKVPPFEVIDDLDTAIETRLRYRYVDLRRRPLQRNLAHRSRFINALRRAFEDEGFLEIETPVLNRATPEGARDYLVPSRVHPGEFYALPQSPQLFKQILMVAGYDRYFQVARCFRDEDLRADRQPEFTQLDMEMSFVEEEDVFAIWERALRRTFAETMQLDLPATFPRMRWSEAMERFGVDKPDTRFGMELQGIDAWAAASEFGVFRDCVAGGGRVMAIVVAGGREGVSRGQMKPLEKTAKEFGAKGLAWWKPGEEGGAAGPMARWCEGAPGARLMEQLGASADDLVLFCADRREITWRVLGQLRLVLARQLGLVPEGRWDFLWVTHFPMFERDEASGRWASSHHPFTAPEDWSLSGDPGDMCSRAYDLVLNGWELGSGSVRIHRGDVQQRVFDLLGIGADEQRQKFGFFLEALSYGAPPHGGFAVGLDRLVALTLGLDNIRDVIPFPKTTSASDLMCEAPSPVAPEQLEEVHIQLRPGL